MVLSEELEDDPPPPPPPATKPNPATPAIHPVVEDAVFVRSCSSSFLTSTSLFLAGPTLTKAKLIPFALET